MATKKKSTSTKSLQDDFRNKAEDFSGYAEAFTFENEGDMIVGRLVRQAIGFSRQGGSRYPILVIADEDSGEERSVHAFHRVLRSKLSSERPQIGERVAIKRLTDRKSADYRYYDFLVMVDRKKDASPEFDYDRFVEDDGIPDVPAPHEADDDGLPF